MNAQTVSFVACLVACIVLDCSLARAHADLFRRTASDSMVHWESRTVRMLVDPALTERFGPEVLRALTEAANAWDLGGQVPRVELIHDAVAGEEGVVDDTSNWIGVADSWTFGDKLAVTVSTFDSETGAMIAAQIWINPGPTFQLGKPASFKGDETYDLQAVLTHELGHVLGLGEAEDVPDATMFPTFVRGDTHQRTLSEIDEDAVDELYAQTCSARVMTQCSSGAPGVASAQPWLPLLLAVFGILARFRSAARHRQVCRRLETSSQR